MNTTPRPGCPVCRGPFKVEQFGDKFQAHCQTVTCWAWGPERPTPKAAAGAFIAGEFLGKR